MSHPSPDLLLVGGGLANTLIALRLAERRPDIRVTLLEQAERIGGNHTWSFHGSDLPPATHDWMTALAGHHWSHTQVRFPGRERTLAGTYHSMTAEQLAEAAEQRLQDIRCGVTVSELRPDGVTLADGTELNGKAVIDGRGPTDSEHLDVRFQKFVGRIVQLKQPHQLDGPIIMDATMVQEDGYRFFYTLPLTKSAVLIEDTRYSDNPSISTDDYGSEIEDYAQRQGWSITQTLRTESGVLPITLGGDIEAFWKNTKQHVARSGLRAALFHPATGYSLLHAVRLAEMLCELPDLTAAQAYRCTRNYSTQLWQQTGFYRALNRMLFLAADPVQRWELLQRFYGLNAGLISRFYAGENTFADKCRILIGKPPVALHKAFSSVFLYKP